MKPCKLTMRGFRSYHEHEPIVFHQDGLSAMVGDTGAGKSSILQAMIYALYNAAPWDGRSVHDLIGDTDDRLYVALEFEVAGDLWEVTRSTSRRSGQPVHRLRCLSRQLPDVDGDDAVKQAVTKLLGMNCDTFKAAVILPQDQFQELLHARPTIRTAMLKSIFRLHELDHLQEATQNAVDELQPLLARAQAARAELLPDPDSTEREATKRRSQAQKGLAQLERWQRAYQAAIEQSKQWESEQSGAQVAHDAIVIEDGSRPDLRPMLAIAQDIQAQLTALAKEREGLNHQAREHQRLLDQEAEGGRGIAQLTELRTKVSALPDAVARIKEEAQRLTQEASDIAGLQRDMEEARGRINEIALLQAERSGAVSLLVEQCKTASTTLQQARQQLGQVRDAGKAVQRRHDDLDQATTKLAPLAEDQGKAKGLEDEARAALKAAEADEAEARNRNMAAALGQHLHAGDTCPVCAQPVPKAFKPPMEPDLQACINATKAATNRLSERSSALQDADGALKTTEYAIEAAKQELGAAAATLDGALVDLATYVTPLPDPLPEDDASVLAKLIATEAALAAQLDEEREHAKSLEHERTTLAAQVELRQPEVDRRSAALKSARSKLELQVKQVQSVEQSIPSDIRGEGPAPDRVPAILQEIGVRLSTLEQHNAAVKELREKAEGVAEKEEALREREKSEVRDPHQSAVGRYVELHLHCAAGARVLAHPPPLPRPEPFNLASDATWAEALLPSARELRAALETRVKGCALQLDETRQRAAQALLDAEAGDEQALTDRIVAQKVDIEDANRQIERAQKDREQARILEPVLSEASSLAASLGELRRQLQPGKFPGFVVEHRQKSLLRIASQQLALMTNQRYGFSEDFDIVDQPTKQARSPQTLSGGETFLASLSLALGLVEMAGRSGGLIESLFLDEGFGALDANALDVALDALYTHVSAGRTVTVVSHLRAIAERVDPLLLVTKDALGSHARWVTGDERERLLDTELEAGLVA